MLTLRVFPIHFAALVKWFLAFLHPTFPEVLAAHDELAGKLAGGSRARSYQRTAQKLAHGEQQAEQWIVGGRKMAGLDETALAALMGSDARKVALAQSLHGKRRLFRKAGLPGD